MSANAWLIISVVGFSLAGILLVVAAVLFFILHIPALIGELNGKTAMKQIENIRSGINSQRKAHYTPDAQLKTSADSDRAETPLSRSAVMAAHASKRLDVSSPAGAAPLTDVLTDPPQPDSGEDGGGSDCSTAVLEASSSDVTALLSETGTQPLSEEKAGSDSNATEVLQPCSLSGPADELHGETMVLGITQRLEEDCPSSVFEIARTMVVTHTDEAVDS